MKCMYVIALLSVSAQVSFATGMIRQSAVLRVGFPVMSCLSLARIQHKLGLPGSALKNTALDVAVEIKATEGQHRTQIGREKKEEYLNRLPHNRHTAILRLWNGCDKHQNNNQK